MSGATVAFLSTAPVGSDVVAQVSDEAILREAWYRVQHGGRSAGVDGVSVAAFRPQAEQALSALREDLLARMYRPAPVKLVEIPKPAGGVRRLGVPTVRDRIAQTSAALVLQTRVANLFSDRSFAYRPFLGPRRAAIYLRSITPEGGWVVTADIEKFFDNVDHAILTAQLRAIAIDEEGIGLILRWLTTPVQDGYRRYQPVKGLPQGAPVSPLLANVYLSGFDTAVQAEGYPHVRYADDFVAFAPDEPGARQALNFVSSYLSSRLRLRIKPAKTQYGPVSRAFNFVGFELTDRAWKIPGPSLDRFKEAVEEIFSGARGRRDLSDEARAHNDLVRGWRNYYFGNSREMDDQLRGLDEWRHRACLARLAREGQSAEVSTLWFDRLVTDPPPSTSTPPEIYAHEETSDRTHGPVADEVDEWHRVVELPRERDPRDRLPAAARRRIRDAAIGARQAPSVDGHGLLRIPTFGAFVTTAQGLIIVRRRKQIIYEVSPDDVSSVTIEADGIAISGGLVALCAHRAIPVSFCRISGRPIARILAARTGPDTTIARKQLVAHAGRTGGRLAATMIEAKLANQRALLLYHAKYQKRDPATREVLIGAAAAIQSRIRELAGFSSEPLRLTRRSVFLIEARAAESYWRAFARLAPARVAFPGRVGRGAQDVINKALNYGYAVLLNEVWLAICQAGLHPAFGVLHVARRRSAGLAFDLMEPFRQPVIDRAVLSLLGRGAHLELNAKGALRLRTRGLLRRAIAKRLSGPASGASSLFTEIQRAPRVFRRALQYGDPYTAYRMPW